MRLSEQEAKLNEWLSQHAGLLVKVARSFTQSAHDYDDVLQEIAYQVWRSIPRYTEQVKESTWIYRVALYTAIDWSRKEQKRAQRLQDYSREHSRFAIQTPEPDPRLEWLYDRLAQLPLIDRSLTLLLLDGFSYREMSDTLGMSESNVGVRISRIKKKLAEEVAQENPHEL